MMSRVTPHHVDQSFYAVCDVGTARPVSITLDKAITQGPIYDLAQGPPVTTAPFSSASLRFKSSLFSTDLIF